MSIEAVENLVLELESRHPNISRTELLVLSYVPTGLLALLTRRNQDIETSRRKSEPRRRSASNPLSEAFAEAIHQIIEEGRELGTEVSGDDAITIHLRSLHLSPDQLKDQERRLGGGTHFSAWSFAIIPLTANLTVQLEPDTLPGRFEVSAGLLAGRYGSLSDARWRWTGNSDTVRNRFRGSAAGTPRSWPRALDVWLRWRVLTLIESTPVYAQTYRRLPSWFTARDVIDRVGLEYEQEARVTQLLREPSMPLEIYPATDPPSFRYQRQE
jgi:hypothetical protein